MTWLVLALLFLPMLAAAQSNVIKIPRPGVVDINSPSYYPEALLALVLEKTRFLYGDFHLQYIDEMYVANRLRAMLIDNKGLDVMWSSVTPERKLHMRALEYDIFYGLQGYRRLLIRIEDAEEFKNITTLEQLKKYRAGVGFQWSDKDVFSYNKLPFVAGTQLGSLGKMLAAKRFDYLPRASHEYRFDLSNLTPDLMAVEHLILHYCQPVNFFVNKNNYVLGDRLALGLSLAQSDGSWDHLLHSVPSLRQAQADIQQFKGVILRIKNPSCDGSL